MYAVMFCFFTLLCFVVYALHATNAVFLTRTLSHVIARAVASGAQSRIAITNDKGRLSSSDIDAMIADADAFAAEDEAMAAQFASRLALEVSNCIIALFRCFQLFCLVV
jgi:hypothetical protein